MTEDLLSTFRTQAVSAVNLLAVLDAAATDGERLDAVFAFIGTTAELVDQINTGAEPSDAHVDALKKSVDRAYQIIGDHEVELVNTVRRTEEVEKELADLEEKLKTHESPTGTDDLFQTVATAHKRLAEGLRKFSNGDYDAAVKKLITAEKTLKKIDGKEYQYD